MALVAQLDVEVGLGGVRRERVAARALDGGLDVGGVDVGLHWCLQTREPDQSTACEPPSSGRRVPNRTPIGPGICPMPDQRPAESDLGARPLGDLGQELVVAAGRLDLVHQQLQAGGVLAVGGQGVQDPAQLPDLLELAPLEQELLVAGGAGVDVDGRVEPALREPAVEPQLHVAGALELLEDDLVHLGAGLHQRGGQDRQRTALLDVPGRAEELLGRVQRTGVDTTGHDAARRRRGQVVGPGQAGDAVEDDHDVATHLHQTLGPLDRQLGHLGVLLGRPVEGRRDDLALDGAAHVGDLFGPLVHQQHHEVHVGVVRLDGVGDLLHDRRLAGLGRRDDHAALPLADRREQVHDPRRQVVLVARHLEVQPRVGEQRREVLELGPVLRRLGVEARHRVDAQQRRVLLVVRSPGGTRPRRSRHGAARSAGPG